MKLAEVAKALGCQLRGDGEVEIVGVASIEDAAPGTLTFLADARYTRFLAGTPAAAIIVSPTATATGLPMLVADHPYLAFVDAIHLFHPGQAAAPGVHPTAVIASTATIGAGASIGPHAVIGDRARIGARAVVGPNVTIYADVTIGDDFQAYASVVVREGVRIGHRVVLHAGAVIGSDGFGFVPLPGGHRKIPQVGTVEVEDDVEIGANTTVDRAQLGATVIGRGAKLDNLVQVAHGCRIGAYSLLAAQVGLGGSTRLGQGVMLGGQVGAAGHLRIGDGVQVGAQSGINNDLVAGRVYGGTPTLEMRRWRRAMAVVAQLPELLRRLRAVERSLGAARTGDPKSDD
jgi:UDP-3-O-[3-hydroxymyristoyl] glucosamine N-acyltransferase